MTLRWGFLGASRIGAKALAPAVQGAGQRLHAVAARDLSRAQDFATSFAAPRAYGSYAALLDDPDIDAVYNALPNDAHLPWTLRALEAGKHVLCEKPLALNADEVAQMQAAEAQSGRRVMEAFCHLFHPQFDRAVHHLRAGAVGRLTALQASFTFPLLDPNDFRWNASQGGGALFDLGCYCASILMGLAGRDVVATSAVQSLHRGVDATMACMLDFGDGLAGQFVCSFDGARGQHVTVIGNEGRLDFDWPYSTKDRETTLTLNGVPERFAVMDPYQAMVHHFARVVVEGDEMRFPLSASLRLARVLDGLRLAAKTTM